MEPQALNIISVAMIGKCSKDNKQVDETTGIKHYINIIGC